MTTNAHPHAALMAQYAQDAAETATPWTRWERQDAHPGVSYPWSDLQVHPEWYTSCRYRRKPRVILINGHEVPEPLRVAPVNGDCVYLVDPAIRSLVSCLTWTRHHADEGRLERGLLHSTREAAEAHAKALLSFTEAK